MPNKLQVSAVALSSGRAKSVILADRFEICRRGKSRAIVFYQDEDEVAWLVVPGDISLDKNDTLTVSGITMLLEYTMSCEA